MVKTLDRTKDIFLDTMLLGNEILTKKIKTTNKTKITVILAAYRNVGRLESIIKDLYNQSFQEFEIIVVDDLSGSEIEEAVVALDNNKINYIKKQLGSNSSAKNCALDFSKGEYVVFVEESSKLKSNYLELLFNEVSQKNLDIAILTRNGYPSILNENISSGQDYLIEEIKKLKSDLNYNVDDVKETKQEVVDSVSSVKEEDPVEVSTANEQTIVEKQSVSEAKSDEVDTEKVGKLIDLRQEDKPIGKITRLKAELPLTGMMNTKQGIVVSLILMLSGLISLLYGFSRKYLG